jgi:hypothetical protein
MVFCAEVVVVLVLAALASNVMTRSALVAAFDIDVVTAKVFYTHQNLIILLNSIAKHAY